MCWMFGLNDLDVFDVLYFLDDLDVLDVLDDLNVLDLLDFAKVCSEKIQYIAVPRLSVDRI